PIPCPLLQFCQPSGWQLFTERNPPTFFVAVLTDINSERHYCACFTFWEAVESAQVLPGRLLPARGPGGSWLPSAGASGSRSPHAGGAQALVLGLIYTIYVDGLSVSLENVIGNLLTCTIP
ncbi:MTMR5 protein, partial [Chloroceryle aenea]|nr:MTMR5 protein [Chloroceryle aenea]